MRTRTLLAMATLVAGCATDIANNGEDHAHEVAVLGGKADNPLPRKAWTLLYYGAADNDLYFEIMQDIEELESVGSTSNVNLLAFIDRPEGALNAYLVRDSDRSNLRSPSVSLGTVDSAAAATLASQLRWAKDDFPAERYAVIVGGHGGGTPRVALPDDSAGTVMSLSDLRRTIGAFGDRIDLLGADACLLGTVETMHEVGFVAHTLVASEDVEPGTGWSYDLIAARLVAKPQTTGEELGDIIVAAYGEAYPDVPNAVLGAWSIDRGAWTREPPPNVFSRLATTLREFIAAAPANREIVREAARQAYRFDDYVDFLAFTEELLARITDTAVLDRIGRARAALGSIGIRFYHAPRAWQAGANGESIYLPLAVPSRTELEAYRKSRMGNETEWDELVDELWR